MMALGILTYSSTLFFLPPCLRHGRHICLLDGVLSLNVLLVIACEIDRLDLDNPD